MLDDLFGDGLDDEATVMSRAQLILAHANLVVHEQFAVESLRGTTGVAYAPLFVQAPVIHAVTVDGRHVGRVRRLNPHRWPEQWVAVPLGGRAYGCFESAAAASTALAAMTRTSESWAS